jgi:hypothetical protein
MSIQHVRIQFYVLPVLPLMDNATLNFSGHVSGILYLSHMNDKVDASL